MFFWFTSHFHSNTFPCVFTSDAGSVSRKSFADEEIVIALGVTMDGQKIPLGFVESATENERICRQLIQDLIRRGLCYDQGHLNPN